MNEAKMTENEKQRLLRLIRESRWPTRYPDSLGERAMLIQCQPSARYELITPQMAADFLKQNTGNRNIRHWWVRALAGAIRRGEWVPTHQGIAITQSGRLLDGQHRLEAIVLSGIPCWMLVVRDVDEEAFMVTDRGRVRSYSDITGLATKTAEVCRIFCTIYFPKEHGGTTSPQMLKLANTGIGDLSDALTDHCGTTTKVFASASFRAAAVQLVLEGVPREHVFSAYRAMVLRDDDRLTQAMKTARRQVEDGKLNTDGGDEKILYLFAYACELFSPKRAYNTSFVRVTYKDSLLLSIRARVAKVLDPLLGK